MSYDKESFMKGLAVGRILWKPPRELGDFMGFKFTVSVSSSGDTLNLSSLLWAGCSGSIKWGDGTSESYSGTSVFHRYSDPGSYQIVLFYSTDCPAPATTAPIHFSGIDNFLVSIDTPLPKIFADVTSFWQLCHNCYNLVSVTGSLFLNCPKVESLGLCFEECRSLTEIPNTLLYYTPLLEDMYYCWRACTALSVVPSGLFDNCPFITSFISTFSRCTNLTSAPALYDLYPTANGSNCFYLCYNLPNYADIPAGWK